MKIQSGWPIIAAISGLLAFLSWAAASSQDEKPVISATTGPYYGYHDFELFGTKKTTTESYKRYTVRIELTNAQSHETPPKKWRIVRYVSYRNLRGTLLEWGLASKDAGLESIKDETYKSLMWHDRAGTENYIQCADSEYTNGRRYHQRLFKRSSVNDKNLHTLVGGFSLEVERDNGTVVDQKYLKFDPRTAHYRKVLG